MYDEDTGMYYCSKGTINLTKAECKMLNILTQKTFVKDEDFYKYFSYSYTSALISRINGKMKGEFEIIRRCSKGYYIKYIGGKTNEITRSKRIYKRKLHKLPRTM